MIEIFKGASAQHRVQCLSWVLAVSKRLLEKVISGSSNDAGSFRGLPMP